MKSGFVDEIVLTEGESRRMAKLADSEDFQFFKEIVEGRILQARAYATLAFNPEEATMVHGEFVLWREIMELIQRCYDQRDKV